MKTFIPFTIAAALAASGLANAQTPAFSTPSGYVTVKVNPGVFNLVGVTLHEPIELSGTLDSATSNSVDDADVNFSSLAAGVYILELTDGSGVLQEVTVLDSDTLVTSDDLSGNVSDGVTTYKLRRASTLDSVFGSDNSKANLKPSTDGSANGVDKVIVQTVSGLKSYYYVDIPGTLEGWFDGAASAGDTVLNYADGLYVQTLPGSTATDFVIVGAVKVSETASVLKPGFNLLSAVTPAGLTLGTCGLEAYIAPSTDGSSNGADILLIPNPLEPGSFSSYYYVNIPGTLEAWFDGANVADDIALEGAFFLNNLEGSVKPYVINGPTLGS